MWIQSSAWQKWKTGIVIGDNSNRGKHVNEHLTEYLLEVKAKVVQLVLWDENKGKHVGRREINQALSRSKRKGDGEDTDVRQCPYANLHPPMNYMPSDSKAATDPYTICSDDNVSNVNGCSIM